VEQSSVVVRISQVRTHGGLPLLQGQTLDVRW
jgi:hypothetical protein